MAIFNNSDIKPDIGGSNTTIITAGSKIKGEIELTCNLYIDGELEGSIKSTKEVNIGQSGRVQGTISTEKVIVQGFVDGTIVASKVEIKAKGRVSGEITSNELVIESQGIFEGTSIVKDSPLKNNKPLLGELKS